MSLAPPRSGLGTGNVRNYDLEFLKRFSLVIVFLSGLTIALIILAYYISKQLPYEASASAEKKTLERIAPVGAVYAGRTGLAQQAAADEAAKDKAKSAVAYGGTTDGKVIYDNLCTGCHTSGSGGAPTLDAVHWTARIAQGTETLYKHSIEGFTGATGMMPARGGNPALTDEQMHATVDWMLTQIK